MNFKHAFLFLYPEMHSRDSVHYKNMCLAPNNNTFKTGVEILSGAKGIEDKFFVLNPRGSSLFWIEIRETSFSCSWNVCDEFTRGADVRVVIKSHGHSP